MHFPERATRGLQSTPLAIDGVLYYSGSYSRVYALDGERQGLSRTYAPDLDEELVAKQTHSPYNRGIAIGHGNLYVGARSMGACDSYAAVRSEERGKLGCRTSCTSTA